MLENREPNRYGENYNNRLLNEQIIFTRLNPPRSFLNENSLFRNNPPSIGLNQLNTLLEFPLVNLRQEPAIDFRIQPTVSSFCDSRGLAVKTRLAGDDPLTKQFPPQTLVGRMDFQPDGKTSYVASRTTEFLVAGITGLQAFFDRIDRGMVAPEYLYGITNRRMASATRRFGFTIEDMNPREPQEDKHRYMVLGKTIHVRQKLTELLAKRDHHGRSVLEMLQQRLSPASENV